MNSGTVGRAVIVMATISVLSACALVGLGTTRRFVREIRADYCQVRDQVSETDRGLEALRRGGEAARNALLQVARSGTTIERACSLMFLEQLHEPRACRE